MTITHILLPAYVAKATFQAKTAKRSGILFLYLASAFVMETLTQKCLPKSIGTHFPPTSACSWGRSYMPVETKRKTRVSYTSITSVPSPRVQFHSQRSKPLSLHPALEQWHRVSTQGEIQFTITQNVITLYKEIAFI